jgi:8-oxo-dGTP diphosphatase
MQKTEQIYHLGIKAIIKNPNNQILLLKRRHLDYWDLPGGRVQEGEEPLAALTREVQEETGLDKLANIQPQQIILTPFKISLENHQTAQLMFWFYKCSILHEEPITLSDEHSEFLWASLKEVQILLPKISMYIL